MGRSLTWAQKNLLAVMQQTPQARLIEKEHRLWFLSRPCLPLKAVDYKVVESLQDAGLLRNALGGARLDEERAARALETGLRSG